MEQGRADATSSEALNSPAPRQPKSQSHLAQVQAQNRRRGYLSKNPTYFNNLEHEFADPILYERLLKRFQSPAEREAEGKAKGLGRALEADLLRGESKLAGLAGTKGNASKSQRNAPLSKPTALDNAWDGPAASKEHGQELWHEFLRERFIMGRDEDFDYKTVDENEEYDEIAARDAEDAWFDDEEPGWSRGEGVESEGGPSKQGETGIQDF